MLRRDMTDIAPDHLFLLTASAAGTAACGDRDSGALRHCR